MELIGERWTLQLVNDWRQFVNFRDWNWVNFSVIEIEPEWDRKLGSVSLSVIVLGLGFRASYTYDPETPFRKELRDMRDDWLGGNMVTVPANELAAMRHDLAELQVMREATKPGEVGN